MQNTIPHLESHNEKRSRAFSSTVIGIITIALVLGGGGFVAIKFGPYLPDAYKRVALAVVELSQRFVPAQTLTLSLDTTETDAEKPFTLSFTHENKRSNGVYTISYPCTETATLYIESGVARREVPCESGFDIPSAETTVTLSVSSTLPVGGATFLPITLSFTGNTEGAPSLNDTVTVRISGTATIAETPTPSVTIPTKPATQAPTGASKPITAGTQTEKTYTITNNTTLTSTVKKTDLAPKIISVGTIDRITNAYTPTTTLMASDRIAVKFEVENLGTADSGHWQFNAVLPTFPMHIFESEGQQSLAPGDKIEYTLGFDNVIADQNGDIVINVDPTKSISEASEDNNIVRVTIFAKSK